MLLTRNVVQSNCNLRRRAEHASYGILQKGRPVVSRAFQLAANVRDLQM
jgi:hypothetical protein